MSKYELDEMLRLIEETRRNSTPEKADERLKASGFLKADGGINEPYQNLELPEAA